MKTKTNGTRPKALDPRRRAYFRGKLLERRRRLLERLDAELQCVANIKTTVDGDVADQAAANSEQEDIFRIGSIESDAVARIDYALQRLDDGTYGVCEECGKRIPQARLKVLPFATSCVQCQETIERDPTGNESLFLDWSRLAEEDLRVHTDDEFSDNALEEPLARLRAGRPGTGNGW